LASAKDSVLWVGSLERPLAISTRRSGTGKHFAFTRELLPSALLLRGVLRMGPARGFVGFGLRLGIGDTETVMIRGNFTLLARLVTSVHLERGRPAVHAALTLSAIIIIRMELVTLSGMSPFLAI
jgi:hypothetical protein